MCYKCRQCGAVEPPRHKLRRYTVYRTSQFGRKEVAQEYPVCAECYQRLAGELHVSDETKQANAAYQTTIQEPRNKGKHKRKDGV